MLKKIAFVFALTAGLAGCYAGPYGAYGYRGYYGRPVYARPYYRHHWRRWW